MAENPYRSFTIIFLSMALLLISSCSHSQKKEEYKKPKTPREVVGFYTEQEGAYPGSQPTVNSHFNS